MSDPYHQYGYGRPPPHHHHIPGQNYVPPYPHHQPQPSHFVCPPSVGGGHTPGHIVNPPSVGNPCMPTAPPPIAVCPAKPEYPHPIYPSLPTGGHNPGMGVTWVPSNTHSALPAYAVKGGMDCDGTDIFVGRAFHEGDTIPAKVIPAKQIAYIAYGGREIMKHNYEVLCATMYTEGRIMWRPACSSNIPYGAIPGGNTSNGEPLYIGRVFHQGAHTVGKVHPSHGSCYIPFDGQEISFHDYEILVQN